MYQQLSVGRQRPRDMITSTVMNRPGALADRHDCRALKRAGHAIAFWLTAVTSGSAAAQKHSHGSGSCRYT